MDVTTAPPSRSIRVVIVDDHALVREGTAELLGRSPEIQVVGQAASAEELLASIDELHPDVAVVDVELPGMNGIELAHELGRHAPGVHVLIVSAYEDHAYVTEALDAGVSGYLLKTASGQELVDAVRTVESGALVLDAALSQRVARRWRERRGPAAADLTFREKDVLGLLGRGMSNKQIAGALGLGVRTVESYVSNILAKLGVESRTEAALLAATGHAARPRTASEQVR